MKRESVSRETIGEGYIGKKTLARDMIYPRSIFEI